MGQEPQLWRTTMGYRCWDIYKAIIPAVYLNNELIKKLIRSAPRKLLASLDGDVHISVANEDGGWEICGRIGYVSNSTFDSLFRSALQRNLICLVYESTGDTSWNDSDTPEPLPYDPVAEAEKIPTLILREVLAKRLELS